MTLELERPLIVFDLEATGRSPQWDRIVELAAIKLHPGGGEETWQSRFNPGVPIPAEATAVHGIRDADVAGAPAFAARAAEIAAFFADSDVAGFGLERYDLPLLAEEMRRAGVEFRRDGRAVLDAQVIFHRREPRDLSAAHRLYCGEGFSGAHSAEADARAAWRVLLAQLERYADLPRRPRELHEALRDASRIDADGKLMWVNGEAAIGFGKHRGRTLRDLAVQERGYLDWILAKDFSEEVKAIVRGARDGKFPRPPAGE